MFTLFMVKLEREITFSPTYDAGWGNAFRFKIEFR